MKQIILFSLVLLLGCNSAEENDDEQFELHRDYIEQQAHGDEKSFIHYLSLKGCREEYCDFMLVLNGIKKYYDTCTTKRPIKTICILRGNKEHHFESGEPNYLEVYKDALIELDLDYTDTIHAFPIKKMSFFENGKHKEINMSRLNALINNK